MPPLTSWTSCSWTCVSTWGPLCVSSKHPAPSRRALPCRIPHAAADELDEMQLEVTADAAAAAADAGGCHRCCGAALAPSA